MPRNPAWTRWEIAQALRLYHDPEFAHGTVPKSHRKLRELSERLRSAVSLRDQPDPARYRNDNGAYKKLLNFRQFDPHYVSRGQIGLTHGGQTDGDVWREFDGRWDALPQ